MGKTYTDAEALYGIRDAVSKLNSSIEGSRKRFISVFSDLDDQICRYLLKKERELEGKDTENSNEGRTDTFHSTRSGGSIMLMILGDETRCRESGCNGIAKRIYTSSDENVRASKQRIIDDIERARIIRAKINECGERISNLLSLNSSSGIDTDNVTYTLNSWIGLLNSYGEVVVDDEVDSVKKKMM